jgi:hypothetical protein
MSFRTRAFSHAAQPEAPAYGQGRTEAARIVEFATDCFGEPSLNAIAPDDWKRLII